MSLITRGVRLLGGGARRVARAVRHTPDRLLHRTRQRRMVSHLRSRPARTVLFMCLGNICRSPFAAAVLRERSNGADLIIDSAGFIGPDRASPDTAQRAARRRGIDLSAHRSRLVTPALVESAELIVVMDRAQGRTLLERFDRRSGVLVLGDLDPDPIDTRTIRDPYSHGDEVFDHVYQRIERCVETLFSTMQHQR